MIRDIELLCQIQGFKTLKTNGIAFFVFFGDALAKSIERKSGHELIEKLACSSKKRAIISQMISNLQKACFFDHIIWIYCT